MRSRKNHPQRLHPEATYHLRYAALAGRIDDVCKVLPFVVADTGRALALEGVMDLRSSIIASVVLGCGGFIEMVEAKTRAARHHDRRIDRRRDGHKGLLIYLRSNGVQIRMLTCKEGATHAAATGNTKSTSTRLEAALGTATGALHKPFRANVSGIKCVEARRIVSERLFPPHRDVL